MYSNEINYKKGNNSDPNEIKFLNDINNDSYAKYVLDNTFCTFKSIYNFYYLIYTNIYKSIISYNLDNYKKLKEIKNAHKEYISNFRHYLDNIYKRDLILSISCEDNTIKLWDVNNLDLLLNIERINKIGELDSACFLNDNNKILIISSNDNEENEISELIKIFDFNGNKIKEINNSNDNTFFIDSFFDKKFNKNYIITSNYGYIKSYDYNENKIYFKYYDYEKRGHFSLIVTDIEEEIKIIESVCDGNIRIWGFHTGILLKKIKVSNYRLYGMCLWDNDFLFVGCEDKNLKLIDLKNEKIIKNLIGHDKDVITIRKINSPLYGECLISQGWREEKIKIWGNQKF